MLTNGGGGYSQYDRLDVTRWRADPTLDQSGQWCYLKDVTSSAAGDAPAPGRAIHILMPMRALGAGRYVLIIFGIGPDGRETEVARYPFNLRFE